MDCKDGYQKQDVNQNNLDVFWVEFQSEIDQVLTDIVTWTYLCTVCAVVVVVNTPN